MRKVIVFITFLIIMNEVSLSQWKSLNSTFGSDIKALLKVGNGLFATTSSKGVFYSSNSDQNWVEKNIGLTNLKVYSIAANTNNLIVGTYGNGVYISNNNGDTWIPTASGISVPYIYALAYLSNNIIAGTGGGGIFRSTNNGASWTNAGGTTHIVNTIYVTPNYSFIGQGPYAYKSTDNGMTWINLISQSNTTIKCFAETDRTGGGKNIFVGTLNGVYKSSDDGTSWKATNNGLTYQNVNAIVATGQNLFVATENGGVFRSSDNGANWSQINTGLPSNTNGRALILSNSSLFLGTSEGVIWKRELSDFGITDVKEIVGEIPNTFELYQNYPNPFNPNTTITFTLAEDGLTTLKIYDILGREVQTLVNEELKAGQVHRVEFDGSKLASGVYFYKLESESMSMSKKLILMK